MIEKSRLCTYQGRDVFAYRLAVGDIDVRLMEIGATILSIETPDRNGRGADIVLGFDNPLLYLEEGPHFGGVVGRYANRIGRGRLEIDGALFQLPLNDGENHLHGGYRGFDRRLWRGETEYDEENATVVFSRLSPDGEEGYPGNLDVRVSYTLNRAGELKVEYGAVTDSATVVNLSQHAYFNLNGHDSGTILEHEIDVNAARFIPVGAALIPTGELRAVQGTPMDLRSPRRIVDVMDMSDRQIQLAGGFDHNWVIDGTGYRRVARASSEQSGRTLEVLTDEPGIQFYTGNFLPEGLAGKGGARYGPRAGFCLETQHFPDSPNHSGFPSTVLRADETYTSVTCFRFGTEA